MRIRLQKGESVSLNEAVRIAGMELIIRGEQHECYIDYELQGVILARARGPLFIPFANIRFITARVPGFGEPTKAEKFDKRPSRGEP
jgi:hypothetical protein